MTFYLYGGDSDRQNGYDQSIYQTIVVSTLKNWSCGYFNHYIIKFIGFMKIYYIINLDIVSSGMVFNYLYIGSIDVL